MEQSVGWIPGTTPGMTARLSPQRSTLTAAHASDLPDHLQHVGAVALEFALADAADLGQRVQAGRALAGDGRERGVMEDDVGRHMLLGGALPAPDAERIEQGC